MLSNGGPKRWSEFVEQLTGDARTLIHIASEDVRRIYQEPFNKTVFDWINATNGELDEVLQRFILRFNAYDFSGLSEEILGDIYQQFLPVAKRKRLGEFYTPPSIIDWILENTVKKEGVGRLLDPSCGSGSFLIRYINWRLEDAKARKLDPHEIRKEVQDEVWGFDLNPFASFISYFQMMWALLRFLPSEDPPDIHIYNLNALLRDSDIAPVVGEEHLPPGTKERDGTKWKYVLGNPPYIRAERVKYGEEMRDLWKDVWGQNSDTGLLFLTRAINEWLEDGGFLGMVVSGGYANSAAAAKVWELLYPGKKAALRKLVWLEFSKAMGCKCNSHATNN
jgi:type I restriction-modification system DNA methylase subunit